MTHDLHYGTAQTAERPVRAARGVWEAIMSVDFFREVPLASSRVAASRRSRSGHRPQEVCLCRVQTSAVPSAHNLFR